MIDYVFNGDVGQAPVEAGFVRDDIDANADGRGQPRGRRTAGDPGALGTLANDLVDEATDAVRGLGVLLTLSGSGQVTASNVIAGGGTLTLSGSGTLALFVEAALSGSGALLTLTGSGAIELEHGRRLRSSADALGEWCASSIGTERHPRNRYLVHPCCSVRVAQETPTALGNSC